MEGLINGRWGLLLAALVAAATIIGSLGATSASAGSELLLPLAAILQAAGAYGFSRRLAARNQKGGWPVFVAYAAAAAWVVVVLSALAGYAAGPGGLVYGLLITLPAMALAPLLQIAALIGLWFKEKKAA